MTICRHCANDRDDVAMLGTQYVCAPCLYRALNDLNMNYDRPLPKGVSLYKGRYKAQITVNGKAKHLGMFGTPDEAHEAFIEAKTEYIASGASNG